jgi:hypothetical protein
VSATQDAHTEHAVLGFVIEELPCLMTVPEIVREIDPTDADAVRRAVRSLLAAGLLRQEGASLLPTRAAVRFERIWSVIQ